LSPRPGAPVSIELTPAQTDYVARAAQQAGGTGPSERSEPGASLEIASAWLEDRKMSRSLLTGLQLLCALPPDGAFTTSSELARTLGISPSTCHRYLVTLLEIRLVERDPHKRHYRRVASVPSGTSQ
jgi:hypothetical protein